MRRADRMYDLSKQAERIGTYVTELEDKNTKLKRENESLENIKNKAKELIKMFLGFAEAFGYSPSMDKFIAEAEQFIKDSEV